MATNDSQYDSQNDIVIDQGCDFILMAEWKDPNSDKPLSLSGSTISGAIWDNFVDKNKLANFFVDIVDVSGGIFAVSLPKEITATFEPSATINKSQRIGNVGVYDLYIIDEHGKKFPMGEGAVRVNRKVN